MQIAPQVVLKPLFCSAACFLPELSLTSRTLCRWCSGLNTVGIFLTFLFVPEPLRVPLAELDRRYAYSQAGKVYHGASAVVILGGGVLDHEVTLAACSAFEDNCLH